MLARIGRYEILRELGVGGMARVYLARSQGEGGFERLVAVKLLHDHLAQEQEFVSMFLDEARLAAQIRHPNVVSTIDVQVEDGKRYLVMEYVEGQSLSRLLSQRTRDGVRLPIGIALRITLDMLAGLHAAHEVRDPDGAQLGLVHRDVSPHNVLVGADGLSRITDFGVARAESRLSSTRSGEIKGKLPYMAPEQIASMPVDRRADVYSAALVAWEMFTGRRHFVADNQGALLRVILEGPLERPSAYNPEVPAEVEAVLMRAMTRERNVRHASAAELADDIEDAAHRAGVRIATARVVAGELRDNADPRPVETRARPATGETSAPSASRPQTELKPFHTPVSQRITASQHGGAHAAGASVATASISGPPGSGAPTTEIATVAPLAEGEPPKRGRGLIWALAGVVLIGGGVAAAALLGVLPKAPSKSAQAGATSTATAATSTRSAPETLSSSAPLSSETATPPNPATSSATDASASGSSVAGQPTSAPAPSTASSTTAPSARPGPIGPRGVPATGQRRPDGKGASDFLPGDL
ncbi:MAG: protein kinase [Polyangiaceae bacterium]|nr:protein kinase [Polyangiaceae bacterium]